MRSDLNDYMAEKEDILIAEKYKNLLDILGIELTKDIIAKYPYITMEFGDLSDYYVERMYETHVNF